ncbi:hypothetical protein BDR06DRAFT_72540 [Suillus hirtellus]|nr:hypothetical protein BDR06DRAFT_72540 [Suillus hirtellus]
MVVLFPLKRVTSKFPMGSRCRRSDALLCIHLCHDQALGLPNVQDSSLGRLFVYEFNLAPGITPLVLTLQVNSTLIITTDGERMFDSGDLACLRRWLLGHSNRTSLFIPQILFPS